MYNRQAPFQQNYHPTKPPRPNLYEYGMFQNHPYTFNPLQFHQSQPSMNQPNTGVNGMNQPYYPMPQPPRPKQPFQGILSHFKKSDGQLDIEKMFSTANQVSNTVKSIGPLLKLFQSK